MNQNKGKSITLFLSDGESGGRKVIFIGGRTTHGLIFPRSKLKEFSGIDASSEESIKRPGIYFLFGKEAEDNPVTSVYIGEAENVFDRLVTHNQDPAKDYWQSTVVFVSRDNSLTKAHVKYLESSSRYHFENGKESSPAHLPLSERAVMDGFLEDIMLLIGTVGYTLFEKIESVAMHDPENPLFYCQSQKAGLAKATGRMTNAGFVVYKGSTMAMEQSPSAKERNEKIQSQLISKGVIVAGNLTYRFEKDYEFHSPSIAARLVLGFPVNGWDFWKTTEGKTLDEIYRHIA
jgi:hypothetical protein